VEAAYLGGLKIMTGTTPVRRFNLREYSTFYGESHIIQGISLRVKKEECVSYLGEMGGKTTTLRSMMG